MAGPSYFTLSTAKASFSPPLPPGQPADPGVILNDPSIT
jgi:hypothetical protein